MVKPSPRVRRVEIFNEYSYALCKCGREFFGDLRTFAAHDCEYKKLEPTSKEKQ